MRNPRLTAAIAGAIVAGGALVILAFGATSAFAASPSPTVAPDATAAATAAVASGTTKVTTGSPFNQHETVSDESVVAGVIGISVPELDADLAKGQTIAAIATAHNVAPQKVIDALVTDGLNELAAQVKAGTITQAQADAQKAAVTQRATDQVNGTFTGGRGGPGGAGCPGGAGH